MTAHAHTDYYCFSADKLLQLYVQSFSQLQDMRTAYNLLLQTLMSNETPMQPTHTGCTTAQDLAKICNTVWGGKKQERCETFMYNIMSPAATEKFKPLEYSSELGKTDFSDLDSNIFNQALNKAVARRRDKHIPSKLQDTGFVFVEQAQEKQLNPFVSAGISLYESSRGTSNLARTKNNIAGLGGPGRWMTFSSVSASIATQATTLKNKIAAGHTNLDLLACSGSYCATDTDPWFRHVSAITKELYSHYNTILEESLSKS